MNEMKWKSSNLNCVRKPIRSRLSLTHHANKQLKLNGKYVYKTYYKRNNLNDVQNWCVSTGVATVTFKMAETGSHGRWWRHRSGAARSCTAQHRRRQCVMALSRRQVCRLSHGIRLSPAPVMPPLCSCRSSKSSRPAFSFYYFLFIVGVMCQPGRCGLPSHLYCLFHEPRPTSTSGLSASLHN